MSESSPLESAKSFLDSRVVNLHDILRNSLLRWFGRSPAVRYDAVMSLLLSSKDPALIRLAADCQEAYDAVRRAQDQVAEKARTSLWRKAEEQEAKEKPVEKAD